MKRTSKRWLLATAIAGAQACASTGSTSSPGQPSLAELEALYQARSDSALARYTEADASFMTGMIHHHAQALVMSGFAETHDASPAVRTLAARTINAQRDEIRTMQLWLQDRGLPVPEVEGEAEHVTSAYESGPRMPGMLSPTQMRQLDAARGPEFDRLFLTLMIQHHTGAVEMVHELFATDGAAQGDLVFKIASDIQVDQRTEIARMRSMLETLPASGR